MTIRPFILALGLAVSTAAPAQVFYPSTPQYGTGNFIGSPTFGFTNPSLPNGFVPNQVPQYGTGLPQGYVQPSPVYGPSYSGRQPDDLLRQGGVSQDTSRTLPPTIQPNTTAPTVEAPRDPKGERYQGRAKVADGNTIVIGGDVIVLNGADAPELDQTCTDRSGLLWKCGRRAMDRLVQLVEGKNLLCIGVSMAGKAIVANCRHGDIDISRTMVSEGWAMSPSAVSPMYLAEERSAQAARSGIWSGTAKRPWEVRAGK